MLKVCPIGGDKPKEPKLRTGPLFEEPLAHIFPDVGEPPRFQPGSRVDDKDYCSAENQGGHEIAGR